MFGTILSSGDMYAVMTTYGKPFSTQIIHSLSEAEKYKKALQSANPGLQLAVFSLVVGARRVETEGKVVSFPQK